jgi:hypothetical protein
MTLLVDEAEEFYSQTDMVLDDWFEDGRFSGYTPERSVARMLQGEFPHLSKDGARRIVKVWFDCARDMGEID